MRNADIDTETNLVASEAGICRTAKSEAFL